MGAAVRRAAPAKLNLYLHVVGRRADGYHLLDSLVAFADIGDVVEARPADALTLALDGPFAPSLDGENLVLKAARLLAESAGIAPRAALRLVKTLPVASGIGGGSSDAAATLRALVELWGIAIPEPTLVALGMRLGADVPVCLLGQPAFLGGIGEELRPAPLLPPVALVLVNPGIPLATPTVFKARRGSFSEPARFAAAPRDAAALASLLAGRRNDLEAAAVGLVPEIAEILARLAAMPGALVARMSGSGATCFALFAADDSARAAAAALRRERPRWWIEVGRLRA